MVKIAVAIYSTYGHILTMSKAEAEGAKAGGADVDVFQLPSGEQNDASANAGLPVLTPSKLAEYDGVIFGIPSRYGTHPYAFKAFFDATGGQWASGTYHGKYAALFVTTGTQGGGQETIIRNTLSVLAHHGINYVPLGYARAFGEITNLSEVHGGSPWGAGSIAGPSGARQPSKLELDTARIQGKSFAETVARAIGKGHHSGHGAAGAAAGAGAAGAGAAGVGAAGAGAAGASGASGAGAGATGASGAGAASTGVPGTKSSAADIGESKASAPGAEQQVKSATGEAKSTADEAKSTAGEAKSAPGKAEQQAEDAEKKAETTGKKEKDGCCSCM